MSSNRKKRKEKLENGSEKGKLSNDSLQRNETQDTAYISIDKNRFWHEFRFHPFEVVAARCKEINISRTNDAY